MKFLLHLQTLLRIKGVIYQISKWDATLEPEDKIFFNAWVFWLKVKKEDWKKCVQIFKKIAAVIKHFLYKATLTRVKII